MYVCLSMYWDGCPMVVEYILLLRIAGNFSMASIKFGEPITRVYWQILNLAIHQFKVAGK